jgi:dienelactone hydrolase
MKMLVVRPWAVRLSFALLVCGCAPPTPQPDPSPADEAIQTPVATSFYVSFPALGTPAPLQVAGQLRLSRSTSGKLPEAGIATLELDMWSARGLSGGAEGRPRAVSETLPDAYGALRFLSAHPAIDGARIGIMGFSWGGVMSMLTATRKYAAGAEPGQRFVAHAPLYPVCWVYNHVPGYEFGELTGAPVFLQAGTADVYDAPDSCQTLLESLSPADRANLSLKMYEGATHGWDRLEPAIQVSDPYAHQGQGGLVDIAPSPESARESRRAVVEFFQRTLAPAP